MINRHLRNQRRKCAAKKWYPREIIARVIGHMTLAGQDGDKQLWPYRCDHCRRWHLTSKPQASQPITARATGCFPAKGIAQW